LARFIDSALTQQPLGAFDHGGQRLCRANWRQRAWLHLAAARRPQSAPTGATAPRTDHRLTFNLRQAEEATTLLHPDAKSPERHRTKLDRRSTLGVDDCCNLADVIRGDASKTTAHR
jgi:hypothetical protein